MTLVVDARVAVLWFFEDQRSAVRVDSKRCSPRWEKRHIRLRNRACC